MNINRDFLIILDVKTGEVDSPNIYYFNTDKNTSNLYVQMVIRETTVEVTPIENAAEYSIKANILKPNMVAKEVEGTLVNPEKAIYEFNLPSDCTDFSGNAKIEFEVYTGDKIATSFATKFKVHGSVLTEQNKYIEDSSDYPILKELMAEVKVINETAHELDTTIRTLQSDMIEANNEMKTNEATRQANETTRVANEEARKEAERTRVNQEVARVEAEATREGQEATRVANENERKTAENNRVADESVRATNEAERKSAEASRVSAENTRVANEEQRQANEANREAAEAIRKANEEARIAEHEAMRTEHEQTMTAVNEVKAENAVLMENDKKIADRMTQVEISDKRQYVIMEGLMNSAGDGYLKIEDTGNDTTLYNSVEGFVDVKNITGNTMVNSIKNPDDELTLNADINTSGQSVTLTTAVDNGQVDVLAEGNTMVNVCDQQEAVAITTDTNTFPLRYLYTSTEYTLQFESDTAVTIDITLGGYTLSSQNIVIGLNKINIITPNELTDNNLILNGTGFNASNIVVTEATDKDFGYFSGMKSVGELEENKIEILSRNNLVLTTEIVDMSTVTTSGDFTIGTTNRKRVGYITVYPNTTYYIKNLVPLRIHYYDENKVWISSEGTSSITVNNVEFTTPENCKYVAFGWDTRLFSDIPVMYSQSNKKQILLNEPLRAVGNTKDRFIQIDGKWYVERNTAEVVLDGSDDKIDMYLNDPQASENTVCATFEYAINNSPENLEYVICDKFDGSWNSWSVIDKEGICIHPNKVIILRINKNKLGSIDRTGLKVYLQANPVTVVYKLASPTYEPVEIAPTVNTYTDVTHITNNSTIPMNMPIVNSGYEIIAKPSTKYTVVGMTNGRIGDSTIVNGSITTPATITDNFLRPYGTGKTSKVMLLEGEPANIPGYFTGIKSVFEDKVTEDGKYACKVRVYNDLGEETVQTLYLDEPLYNANNITIYNDKLGYWKNWDKVVLDGSENWKADPDSVKCKNFYFRLGDNVINKNTYMYCDKFCYVLNHSYTSDIESIGNNNNNFINISIYKAKLPTQDVAGFKQYLSQNPVTVVYQLKEPVFVPLIDNCPNFVIGSWDNCSIHFDSIIPLKNTRYRYTGNVPSVMAMSEDVAETKSISDQQDSMIIDLATQVATMEMMLM